MTHFKVLEKSKRISVPGSHSTLPAKPDKARAVPLWEIRIMIYSGFWPVNGMGSIGWESLNWNYFCAPGLLMSLPGAKSRRARTSECLNTENRHATLLFTTSPQKAREGNCLSFRGIEKWKLWICKAGERLFCEWCKQKEGWRHSWEQ